VAAAMAALTQAAPDLSVKLLTFEIRSAVDLESVCRDDEHWHASADRHRDRRHQWGRRAHRRIGSRASSASVLPLQGHGGGRRIGDFSPHFDAIARRGADYVSKIVKGAKPSELPVEQLRDTRFTSILRPRRRSRSKCRRQCSPAPTRLSSRSASIHVSAAQAHGRNWHSFSVEGEAAMRQLSGAYRPCQFRMTACV
jgi:hypothetical protein